MKPETLTHKRAGSPNPIDRVRFDLIPSTVDVWPVDITGSEAISAQLLPLLAHDETIRAAQVRFTHLRHSFIASRGVLRILLGRYLKATPSSLQFGYGINGKPNLDASFDVKFNVSRSSVLGLLAFTIGCEVGVDVEQFRPVHDIQEIASRCFCAEEVSELMALPAEKRERAFFFCWTRKEAYIKAVGAGLSAPLDSFRVSLHPDEPARFIHVANDTNIAKDWMLHNIEIQLTRRYTAALAYKAGPRIIRIHPLVHPLVFL